MSFLCIFINSIAFFRLASNEIIVGWGFFPLCSNFLMFGKAVLAFLKAFGLKPFSFPFLNDAVCLRSKLLEEHFD